LAESDKTMIVEGNYYFPPSSLNREYFEISDTTSLCAWKGIQKAVWLWPGSSAEENRDPRLNGHNVPRIRYKHPFRSLAISAIFSPSTTRG
jgi:hypothetical protein